MKKLILSALILALMGIVPASAATLRGTLALSLGQQKIQLGQRIPVYLMSPTVKHWNGRRFDTLSRGQVFVTYSDTAGRFEFGNVPAGQYTLATAIDSSVVESRTSLEYSPIYAYSYPMSYQVQTPVRMSWHQPVTLSEAEPLTANLSNANADSEFQMVEAPGDVTLLRP